MELLRFATAGSVDDGKSTLIGRLLHDTKTLFDDVIDAVAATTARRGGEGLDLALVTDGLRAEREQGITIDVAYRYFSTPVRSFVIADTPGHVQYTRNMVTGASTSDVAVILVDARHGLREQSHRHAALSALLGIHHLVLAVNKMDLVDWSEERFHEIRQQFGALADELGVPTVTSIPLCALDGGNVVDPSPHTPWYTGPTLLQHLETMPIPAASTSGLRLPVQLVIKPAVGSGAGIEAERRWYAGSLASGIPQVGDEIVVLPSGTRSRIAAVEGNAPAVRIQLEHELDVSRGDVIAAADDAPTVVPQIDARVAWMADKPLRVGNHYLLKHGTRTVKAVATILHDKLDVTTLQSRTDATQLELNEIGTVSFITALSLPIDAYATNRTMGSFIVIDEITNATVGAGMIREAARAVNVALVGAGPGDPELLTLKAARLIGEADVVLYDRLVSPEILALARPDAELIDVGKRPGGSHTQDVLNELLVLHAQSGRRVVRLKGGDPFLFGRGGEEVEVLARHGIACEVVPGVSSSLAGPAAAGIPVTHRRVARAVTIVTGHEMAASDPVDWSAVARLGGTLVVLMGIERRATIVERLVAGGLSADTPAAVVMHATTPRQRVWTGRVDQLPDAPVESPAVMVIGAVATFADEATALVAAHTLPAHG